MDIGKLVPSLFSHTHPASADETVRQVLDGYDQKLVASGLDDYSLRSFRSAAFYTIPLLLSAGVAPQNANIVEIGCGRGLRGLALGRLFGSYVGIDVDDKEIEIGRNIRRLVGRSPDEITIGNSKDVAKFPDRFGIAAIDVLLINGVLEHLTPKELIATMMFARNCYDVGSIVVIGGTPNRLIPHDSHTTYAFFAQMLPGYLFAEYLEKSSRTDLGEFTHSSSGRKTKTRLYRAGRALSYHNFETHFYQDPDDFHVAFDGYHPTYINQEPLRRDELALQQYFDINGLSVARLFSRTWLEMVLSKNAKFGSSPSVYLVTPQQVRGAKTQFRPQWGSLDRYVLSNHGDEIVFFIPDSLAVSARGYLLVDCDDENFGVDITVNGDAVFSMGSREMLNARPNWWHNQVAIPVPLRPTENYVKVRMLKGSTGAAVLGVLVDCSAKASLECGVKKMRASAAREYCHTIIDDERVAFAESQCMLGERARVKETRVAELSRELEAVRRDRDEAHTALAEIDAARAAVERSKAKADDARRQLLAEIEAPRSLSESVTITSTRSRLALGLFGRAKVRARVSLADQARNARNWKTAVRRYAEALWRNPRNASVWVQYGHALKETGDMAAAASAYRKSLALAPAVADTYLQLGNVLKGGEAARSYLRAIIADPAPAVALSMLMEMGLTLDNIKELYSRHRSMINS